MIKLKEREGILSHGLIFIFISFSIYVTVVFGYFLNRVYWKDWLLTLLLAFIGLYVSYCVLFKKDMDIATVTLEYNHKKIHTFMRWGFFGISIYIFTILPSILSINQ